MTRVGIAELRRKLSQREVSAVEVVRQYLSDIKNSPLNSFLTVTEESALAQAQAIDNRVSQGEPLGLLAGLPLAVKDVFTTRDVATSAGSRVLKGYVPPYTATPVERAINQGAVMLGKTNCDEFAMGSSGENSGFGPTRNPRDRTRVPGGSSSGSAAAVAAGECLAALGSDTGGSIREPAAFCGVVGLKPTYGRVSRWGLIAMTSSFDCPGPITRTVEDAAILLQVIAGHDARDATSLDAPVPDYSAQLAKSVKGLKVGVPKEFFVTGLAAGVRRAVEAAIAKLGELGAEIVELSLPSLPYALAAYYVICPSEVSANLARFDGIKYGSRANQDTLQALYNYTRGELLGPEVKRRIMLGTFVLSAGYYDAYYRKAQAARVTIRRDFAQAFQKVDVIVSPTAPGTAFKLGSKVDDPLAMYLEDVYTVPVNIAGLPAVSIPCGECDNLPVGLQLIGRPLDELTILRLAHAYEQAAGWPEAAAQ